jgi:hypothetical protein
MINRYTSLIRASALFAVIALFPSAWLSGQSSMSLSQPKSTPSRSPGDLEYLSGIVEIPNLGTVSPRGSSAAQGLLVDSTAPGTGAAKYLLHGDIVKAIDEVFIDSWESYYTIMFNHFGGQYVRVWFMRDGQKRTADFPLAVQPVPADYEAMLRVLAAGNPVRLAIVVGGVERLGDYTEEEDRLWRAGAEQMLHATTEAAWSGNMRSFRNFSIVDRLTLDAVIEEHKLSLSGMVEESVQLGRLSGATHVLEVSAKEFSDSTAPQGTYTHYFNRLVVVETGVVAATVVYRVY